MDTITQLQEALTHQQRMMAELSDEMYRQQQDIRHLRDEVARLERRVSGMADGSGGHEDRPHQLPPHY